MGVSKSWNHFDWKRGCLQGRRSVNATITRGGVWGDHTSLNQILARKVSMITGARGEKGRREQQYIISSILVRAALGTAATPKFPRERKMKGKRGGHGNGKGGTD